eukprot:160157-Prorocentrum_minimum.AAC.3
MSPGAALENLIAVGDSLEHDVSREPRCTHSSFFSRCPPQPRPVPHPCSACQLAPAGHWTGRAAAPAPPL